VRQTALALVAFAPGLLFVGVSRVVVPAFYAMKDTRTPVWISFWTLLVNAGAGLVLMRPFGHTGLAMALTFSSIFNCLLLVWALHRKVGRLGLSRLFASLVRLLPAAGCMAAVVWYILQLAPWDAAGAIWFKSAVLSAAVAAGIGVYALSCMVFKVPEAAEAMALKKGTLMREKK
jgi:putative peptidoglycan lipid II flippase